MRLFEGARSKVGEKTMSRFSKRFWASVLPVAAVCVAGTGAASAETFTYSSYSVPGEQDIQILTPADVYGGMGQIVMQGTTEPGNAGTTIMAWCLDVYTYLLGNGYGGSGPFTYNIAPLTTGTTAVGFGPSSSSQTGQLSALKIEEIGGLIGYGDANVSTANVSAATQLAIWEIEYGNSFTFSGVSSATVSQATLEISELDTTTIPYDSDVALLTAVASETNQSLAYDYNPLSPPSHIDPNPTPLPATLPLFATGFGFMGFVGWRRKKRLVNAAAA